MSLDTRNFGEALTLAMDGLTVVEVSHRLDLSKSILSKWRAGKREPHWLMQRAVLDEIKRIKRIKK